MGEIPQEPGQMAFEAFAVNFDWWRLSGEDATWADVAPKQRAAWAVVEAAIRADERKQCKLEEAVETLRWYAFDIEPPSPR
jgi:hypothetical protein